MTTPDAFPWPAVPAPSVPSAPRPALLNKLTAPPTSVQRRNALRWDSPRRAVSDESSRTASTAS
ncbi:MAG: hypothetical protein MZW92_53280 [Comamonadaceae bacterium]|nr:hypothetical protein [Comamonadaceae bacterium]